MRTSISLFILLLVFVLANFSLAGIKCRSGRDRPYLLNQNRQPVCSGIYLFVCQASTQTITSKFLLLK